MTPQADSAALEGVRIIDLTVAVAGPVAAHILGDLGADVIRVEPPFARPLAHLDIAPLADGAPDRPYNRIVSSLDLHRSKRAITLDLAKPAGRDALLRLAAHSDVIIENMSPRVMPQLGLSYGELRAVKPGIVLVSMPAFGLDGPLRDRVSFGPGVDAMSGLSHLTGYTDRGPMNAANYFCDYNAGALAALATIAALRHRDRTGEGQHVECAMLEGELQLVADALLDYAMNRRVQRRTGNAHPSMAPHGVYPCAGDDRWLALACEDDGQWRAICIVIARPELAEDARYADVVSRVRRRADIDAIVSTWTKSREVEAAAAALAAAGIHAAPVQRIEDVLDDATSAARRWIQHTHHPEAGAVPVARAAFTLSRTPVEVARAAPLFGEHNDEVLREVAELSDGDLRELREAKVLRDEPPTATISPYRV